MTKKDKIAMIEELLEIESGSLSSNSVLEDIEEWDSLAVISLIAFFDSELGKELSSKKIREFVTVEDIIKEM